MKEYILKNKKKLIINTIISLVFLVVYITYMISNENKIGILGLVIVYILTNIATLFVAKNIKDGYNKIKKVKKFLKRNKNKIKNNHNDSENIKISSVSREKENGERKGVKGNGKQPVRNSSTATKGRTSRNRKK